MQKLYMWSVASEGLEIHVGHLQESDGEGIEEARVFACQEAVRFYTRLLISPVQLRDILDCVLTIAPAQSEVADEGSYLSVESV